jgi:hypothetical protein
MGLGTTAGSGAGLYMAGYNTLNPNLRQKYRIEENETL